MKKCISALLCLCLFCVPVMADEVTDPDDADFRVVAVCSSDTIEVGDQFLVMIRIDGQHNGYLTYSVAGSFDPETAQLIAPVYKDDGFSIVWNEFSNEDGSFQFDAADINHIKGSTDDLICSLLFEAKKEGKFTLKLGNAAGAKFIVCRTEVVNGSIEYNFTVEGMEADITADTDNSQNIIIAEKKPKTPYDDMDGYEWAEIAVGAMAQLGILDGIADQSLQPGKEITRGEFVAMLMRGAKLSSQGDQFPDVPEDYPFASEIMTAKKKGIAIGDQNGCFNPNDTITRQDISALVCRTLTLMKKMSPAEASALDTFGDKDEISDYAVDTMAAVVRAKLLVGNDDGLLMPKQNMTRAEACALIERVIIHIKLVR